MTTTTFRYFKYSHLPKRLQKVSKPFGDLASALENDFGLADSAEKSVGMRKLLEAKDCFVRAALDSPVPEETRVD